MRIQPLPLKIFSLFSAVGLGLAAQANAASSGQSNGSVMTPSVDAAQQSVSDTAIGLFYPKSMTLENGMPVVVVEMPAFSGVKSMVWYKVGSADEAPGKSGIAHLLEHLMFKETKTLKEGDFSRIIAEVGGSSNAFTSWDYTAYHQFVPPQSLETVLEMEADRMVNLQLTPDMIARELEVVKDERRQRVDNRPGSVLSERVRSVLFPVHAYGIPIIGWQHELEKLDLEKIEAFYQKWYAPNNAVLVVSGNVQADEVFALADQYFGSLEASATIPESRQRFLQDPPLKGNVEITHSDPRVKQNSFNSQTAVVSFRQAHDSNDAYAFSLMAEIFGGGVTSRLNRQFVQDEEKATQAYAYYSGDRLDTANFIIGATAVDGVDEKQLRKEMFEQLAYLVSEEGQITQEELDAAKKRMRLQAALAVDNVEYPARIFGQELVLEGTIEDVEGWVARINAISLEEVRAAAKTIAEADYWVTGYLLTEARAAEAAQ